ncbi:hypothetical protein LX95_02899 [Mesonia algae]|uniref:Uncharacterized protein n=1 Tax=Mesonia algae TaxID=213248 RepID=A0A2W7HU57_9FLAO|nr:hypothetical protein [Mesonia algae]PZW37007.1 hypothetical protein LX95_02899 [Mesonia algae]
MKNLLYPNKGVLILFSIVSLLTLILIVWDLSFTWEFVFGVNFYIILLLIIISILAIISILIDKYKGFKTKKYFIISLIQLLIIWSIAEPVREFQIESSKKKGFKLIKLIESYKKRNNTYPKSLDELENIIAPKITNIGTTYNYKLENNEEYQIGFKSYYGYYFNYDKKNNDWFSKD